MSSSKCCNFLCAQSHQNEVEIFDENLAHISTWLYQTQIHLDEAERLSPVEKEKVVKVRQRELSPWEREGIHMNKENDPECRHSGPKTS